MEPFLHVFGESHAVRALTTQPLVLAEVTFFKHINIVKIWPFYTR